MGNLLNIGKSTKAKSKQQQSSKKRPQRQTRSPSTTTQDLNIVKGIAERHDCTDLLPKICQSMGRDYNKRTGEVVSKAEMERERNRVSPFVKQMNERNEKRKREEKKNKKQSQKLRELEKKNMSKPKQNLSRQQERELFVMDQVGKKHGCTKYTKDYKKELEKNYNVPRMQ